MARVQLLLCFTVLFASVALLDVTSATLSKLRTKPALPESIPDPQTLDDVEGYTVKVVMVFVGGLEQECPKTSKFKLFFDKLRGFAKYVCPLRRLGQKDYDTDMKAKAGGVIKAISSFAIGKIKEEIEEEKQEAIQTFRTLKSLAGRIVGALRGGGKEESSAKLTAEQLKEIKEGILKWETVIARITNTMVLSTSSSSSDSASASASGSASGSASVSGSAEVSTSGKESSSESKKSSGDSSKDTTGSSSNVGSPKGSPSAKTSGKSLDVEAAVEHSSKGTANANSDTKSASSASSDSSSSQTSTVTVSEVETQTSQEVMTFLMNLEKKCPQKEEYKSFFERLKSSMTGAAKKKVGFFSRIKSAAGKIAEAMQLVRSRIGGTSAKVKQSLEGYQGEVMKTIEELDAIYAKIQSQNKGKSEGSLTCTAAQQAEIKQTITKWEQVTTQFVETAVQSESSSSSSSSSSSAAASTGKLQEN